MQPMAPKAVELADDLVFAVTGRHLNDLQRTILHQVWQGQKYLDIAHRSGYTEGHIKDVAYQLWRLLSRVTGEKVTKATVKSALQRYWHKLQAPHSKSRFPENKVLEDLSPPETFHPGHPPPQTTLADAVGLVPPPQTESPSPPSSNIRQSSPNQAGHPGRHDPHFVGRQAALNHLQALLQAGDRAMVIQGEGGLGKTTLAQHFVAQQAADLTLELLMAKDIADLTPAEWVVEEWLRQDFGVEPGHEFGVTLDRLKRHLRQRRVMVLIDNLEPCLDAQGCFVAAHRRYGELLRILTDPRSQTVTVITSRDRLCEPGLPLTHYRLPGLDLSAWEIYFGQRGVQGTTTLVAAMHSAYGGNAKAMELLCGTIQADYGGDVATYWPLHREALLAPVALKNLVESQIHRLRQLDPAAYRLFCRLGVYRYQDVPTVPLAGVQALLADLPPDCQPGVIASLRNRSLLEHHQGRYWLHPVVREGALAQRHQDPAHQQDWQMAHRQAAQYWTESVARIGNLSDALKALEAYYHYIAIQDFAAAARVILHSRDNQWQQFLPLGSTLYRLGLIQPIAEAITTVLDHLPPDNADASELYNILGDLRWIQGRLPDAIACQQSAITLAQASLNQDNPAPDSHRWYYLTMLLVDSQLSLGLYHLDLWELDTAAGWFTQVIQRATGTRHQPWADKATTCLALVLSYQGQRDEAKFLATAVTPTVMGQGGSGRYAFFVQLLGHTYLNLDDLAMAETLFQTAIAAAEAGHYLQIQANALSGLGRLQTRLGNFAAAVTRHQTAIALLEEVGAKCDLATAHIHLALTLTQASRQTGLAMDHVRHHQQMAETLFAAIPAPQQVARIQPTLSQIGLCP